ncbi:15660_t:CDS:1 [Acaulospora morrowiae]|uniref:15660_t:CDS:1 n=1 Tax=Acaulospora morrowiae TaxID=94023 RepID=A0A9N8ZGG0_9GLOM|nr:15660_t:CDS:1 [Acaulospora morrowiae]
MSQDAKPIKKDPFFRRVLFKRSTLEDSLGLSILPGVLEGNDGEHHTIENSTSRPIDTRLLVQELQKPYPLDTLIKLIRELCDLVTKYTFSDITEVWTCVSELLSPEKPIEARTVAFQFMISCIRGQHTDNLGFLRVVFYNCIKSHNISEDFDIRLLALRELCNDGRNISSFEKNLVKLLSEWVNETVQQLDDQGASREALQNIQQEVSSNAAVLTAPTVEIVTETTGSGSTPQLNNPTRLQSVVGLLNQVVKFNFAQFEEHDVTRLVEDIAIACNKSTNISDIICCLDFWDIVVRYGYVPTNSLNSYVLVLCDKVNQKGVISQTSWHIMRNLLRSHCQYGAIKILCSNLEDSKVVTAETTNILRGSVLFLAWATWGREDVESLSRTYYTTILSAMNKSTKIYQDVTVHLEILIQVNDLITKNEDITSLEWEIILDILNNTSYHLLGNKDASGEGVWMLDDPVGVTSDLSGISGIVCAYSRLILQIQSLHVSSSFKGPTSHFIGLIQKLRDHVSENTIIMLLDYYDSEHALYPSSPDWLVMLVDVVNTFFIVKKNSNIRVRVLKTAIDVYEITKDIYQDQLMEAVILPMLSKLPEETDMSISKCSLDFLITVLKETSARWFSTLLRVLIQCCRCTCFSNESKTPYLHLTTCKCVVSIHGLITIFQYCLYKVDFLEHIIEVYSEIIKILGDFSAPVACRLALLQLMIRMRADHDYRIYFVEDMNIMNGAHVLHRDGVSVTEPSIQSTSEKSSSNDSSSGIEKKGPSKKFERRGSLKESVVSQFIKLKHSENRNIPEDDSTEIPYERLWQIPEILQFELSALRSSPYVLCCNTPLLSDVDQSQETSEKLQKVVVLPLSEYLNCLIDILKNEKDWEIYSYILCHLPSQLSKQHLFHAAPEQIQDLRTYLCDSIKNNRLTEGIHLPSDIKKVDVYVAAYQTLTILISYHNLFNKAHRDEIVVTLLIGLQKFAHHAKPCVHALNICLFELPLSATKMLQDTIAYLSKIITSSTMSVHILEFLSGLARLPDLYINFTEADYMRIFGIAMQYIQYSHASVIIPSNSTNSANPVSSIASPAQRTNALFQYERIMAYQVIYLWFMSLRLPERRKYVTFVIHGLLVANGSTQQVDEQTETCFDMLARYTFAECDPKPEQSFINQFLLEQGKDKVKSRTWIQGNALLTIRTVKSLGWAEIVIRRPSGKVTFLCRLENRSKLEDVDLISLPATLMAHYNPISQSIIPLPEAVENIISQYPKASDDSSDSNQQQDKESTKINNDENLISNEGSDVISRQTHHNPNIGEIDISKQDSSEQQQLLEKIFTSNPLGEKEKIYLKEDPHMDPSFLFLQFSPYPDFISRETPIPLPDDDSTARALSILDLAQVVDFHKIGVLYVGKNQTTEVEILSNVHGSQGYIDFLNKLGNLVRLKDCKHVYTGGLDTQFNTDGDYAYYWKDDITQVIFHCATLMPTNLTNDPYCSQKKRHIGNDYVTIVFNESGHDYRFDTLPSHFNYINIVISPHSRGDLSQPVNSTTRTNVDTFYKVVMQRRPDMPEIGPISEFKMISSSALPTFVLITALHANIFSQVFLQSGGSKNVEYVSNWRDRLRQIKRLKERFSTTANVSNERQQTIPAGDNQTETTSMILGLEPTLDFTKYT